MVLLPQPEAQRLKPIKHLYQIRALNSSWWNITPSLLTPSGLQLILVMLVQTSEIVDKVHVIFRNVPASLSSLSSFLKFLSIWQPVTPSSQCKSLISAIWELTSQQAWMRTERLAWWPLIYWFAHWRLPHLSSSSPLGCNKRLGGEHQLRQQRTPEGQQSGLGIGLAG